MHYESAEQEIDLRKKSDDVIFRLPEKAYLCLLVASQGGRKYGIFIYFFFAPIQ